MALAKGPGITAGSLHNTIPTHVYTHMHTDTRTYKEHYVKGALQYTRLLCTDTHTVHPLLWHSKRSGTGQALKLREVCYCRSAGGCGVLAVQMIVHQRHTQPLVKVCVSDVDGLSDLPCSLQQRSTQGDCNEDRLQHLHVSALFLLSLRFFSSCCACALMASTFLLVSHRQTSCDRAYSCQSFDIPHLARSLDTRSFHLCFCPPTARLPPTGAQTRSCFGRRLSSIQDRWPRSRSLRCMSTEDSLCCLAIFHKVVLHFMSLTDTP